MRFVYNTAVSVNGFIADEDNSLAWLFAVENDSPDHERFLRGIGVQVMGATTYEWILNDQDVMEHPERWRAMHGELPTFVFTGRQRPLPPGADIRFVSGPVASSLPAIRAAAGDRDVWVVGGGDLAGQFADAGALDEIRLSVAPATLTGGAPLFPRTIGPGRLDLSSVERVGRFACLTYTLVPGGSFDPGVS